MDSPETYVSLYSGGGGLDLGFKRARPAAKCVAFVEHEASAAALLVDHVEAELVDAAPVYTNAFTFPARRFRGMVDWVIGGPPCQPFSVAGQRRGADDARNLWPLTLRMVGEIQPRGCFFENVPSADSLWYVYENVIPGLRYLGYEVEAGIFSAAEVGAPHNRERVFILGHAGRRSRSTEQRQQPQGAVSGTGQPGEGTIASGELGNTSSKGWQGPYNNGEPSERVYEKSGGRRAELADPNGERGSKGLQRRGDNPKGRQEPPRPVSTTGGSMGNTDGLGRRAQDNGKRESSRADWYGRPMEWPPGPAETEKWEQVIRTRPNLAPATKPGVRGMANGVALGLARAQQLRILGNGVVPATAAHAFTSLYGKVT